MKSLNHILVSISLLVFFIGYSNPVNSRAPQHSISKTTATVSNTLTYNTQSIPAGTHIQIRHRSPHEVDEISVPAHDMLLLYTIKITALEKKYLTRWATYFYVQDDNRPQSQNYPPAHSLRGPPFSC